MAPRRRWLFAVGAAAVAALVSGCGKQSGPSFTSTDITGADFARQFQLTDHDGKARSLEDFRGQVVVVFFGFVHCPDVCPTSLAKLASAMKLLGDDSSRVQVLLITVDPERDTAAVMKPYVTHFHPRFLGLTGSVDDIGRTTKEFRVIAQKQAGATPDAYTVDHSSSMYIFDGQGRVRLFVNGALGAEAIASDIRALLAAG